MSSPIPRNKEYMTTFIASAGAIKRTVSIFLSLLTCHSLFLEVRDKSLKNLSLVSSRVVTKVHHGAELRAVFNFISSFPSFLFAFGGLGFEFCVFVAGWRHALRSEWPFMISSGTPRYGMYRPPAPDHPKQPPPPQFLMHSRRLPARATGLVLLPQLDDSADVALCRSQQVWREDDHPDRRRVAEAQATQVLQGLARLCVCVCVGGGLSGFRCGTQSHLAC